MNAERIARALDPNARPRQTSRGPTFRVPCPAHRDTHPSLDITSARGMDLLHCWSGCTQEEVIQALRARGLWSHATFRAPRAERLDWTRTDNAKPLPECCTAESLCQHWRQFERELLVATLLGNLSEAIVELQAKAANGVGFELEPRAAAKPLTTDEIRNGLRLVGFGGIVPAGFSPDAVEAVAEIFLEQASGHY